MGARRRGQEGALSPFWKCYEVFLCNSSYSKTVDELFMHYFHNLSSASPPPIPVCFSFFLFLFMLDYVCMSVFYLSVCLCGALNHTQPTHLSVLYLYILYICYQATSFDRVVPSGSLPLYFYLIELLFWFLLWKIKYLSIYLSTRIHSWTPLGDVRGSSPDP